MELLAFEVPHGVAVVLEVIVVVLILLGVAFEVIDPIIDVFQGIREWWEDRGD